LEKLLADIRSMEGVTSTVTKVVLSTPKEGHLLGLEEKPGEMAPEGREVTDGGEEEKLIKSIKRG